MWTSWGRLRNIQSELKTFNTSQSVFESPSLAVGNLRSYGDSCTLSQGSAFSMLNQDCFLSWNPKTGRLKAQSGVLFDAILQRCVPDGWFLPVTPGTKFISLGGAIANDIHGKNHHIAGNFGHFVKELELLRSNGEKLICSPDHNSNLFYATIGGLGLTGIILWADIQMIRIQSSAMDVEWIQFKGLEEFLDINKSSQNFPYTVAWLDCIAQSKGKALAKGVYIRGSHSKKNVFLKTHSTNSKKNIPFNFPSFVLNKASVWAFNQAYYHKQLVPEKSLTQEYDPFFYPLDGVLNWNKIYGKPGFFQYQCVVPLGKIELFQSILDCIALSGQASFLSVLKTFGGIPSLGLLSFPQEGFTLCLDFPNKGSKTLALFTQLDSLVLEAGGRLYPAKDAAMKPEHFKIFYPNLNTFLQYKDPNLSSDFWRRVMG